MEPSAVADPISPLLAVDGLRSGFGGKPILQGIDLAIHAREITAVMGRNGVGKSTLERFRLWRIRSSLECRAVLSGWNRKSDSI